MLNTFEIYGSQADPNITHTRVSISREMSNAEIRDHAIYLSRLHGAQVYAFNGLRLVAGIGQYSAPIGPELPVPVPMVDPNYYGPDDAAPFPGAFAHYSRNAVSARTIWPEPAPIDRVRIAVRAFNDLRAVHGASFVPCAFYDLSDHAPNRETYWAHRAYLEGAQAAENAASWTVDGNTPESTISALLEDLLNGDPRADEYLPARPDLSGQWADAPTPRSLFETVTGLDAHAEASWNADAYGAIVDSLCEAFETAVSDTFEPACERVLRANLPTAE